jgi:hypothetical protein
MPLNLPMSIMSAAEFLLWATLGYTFWRKGLQKRFPAMGIYLAIRAGSMPLLLGLLFVQSKSWGDSYFPVYFFSYWAVYVASALTLFFICIEVFRSALGSFSGLTRFGLVVFRWAAVVSVLVSLASTSYAQKGILIIPEIALRLMRSVSVLELCLFAFLCLAMNALQLSIRDLTFGIALGFGLLSSSDFIISSLLSLNGSFSSPLQFVNESVILASLAIWVAYCALPEPARKPVVVAASSTIYRWNEIASALGHKGANVAVPATGNSFFLSDVEKVVDKVLTRNLRESETNS